MILVLKLWLCQASCRFDFYKALGVRGLGVSGFGAFKDDRFIAVQGRMLQGQCARLKRGKLLN